MPGFLICNAEAELVFLIARLYSVIIALARGGSAAACVLIFVVHGSLAAHAVTIELRDDAPDRIERQRAAALGKLPLPGTPDTTQFANRLAAQGLKAGAPMLIRIFKAQSELEVWMEKDGAYVLFSTYPICHWSGTLGPKIREGDKQTPEGFYTITSRQLHRMGRWTRALNLGFPNAFDESLKRDGSYILVHGGCSSVGCFAMTNPVIDEIYTLTSAALRAGQRHVPVHVFPFRMTEANLASHSDSEWKTFWVNLKEGYDAFERTRRPPYVSVCDGRYRVEEMSASPPEAGTPGPLAVCGPTAAALLGLDKSAWLVPLAPKQFLQNGLQSARVAVPSQPEGLQTAWPVTPALSLPALLPQQAQPQLPLFPRSAQAPRPTVPRTTAMAAMPLNPLLEDEKRKAVVTVDLALDYELVPRLVAPAPRPGIREKALPCNLSLASCRRYAALLGSRVRVKSRVAADLGRVRTASRFR
jgi:murein L,D-transpeptidase YafK